MAEEHNKDNDMENMEEEIIDDRDLLLNVPEELQDPALIADFIGVGESAEDLSEEEKEKLLKAQLEIQNFTLSFIKAMLRTGYYEPSHPQSRSAKQGLYEMFRKVMGSRRTLTYMFVSSWEETDVMIEGYFVEPVALSRIMTRGMGDIFIPKFVDFFQRKGLRATTLKSHITQGEFETFIDIMSESHLISKITLEEERQKLIEALNQHKILSVTTVFEEDIVGKQRRLPWRVEMAITRLCKDLRVLPLFRYSSLEQLQRIKMQLFEDIFRPIRKADVLADVLFHADLVQENIRHIEEVKDLQVASQIIRILPHAILIQTANQLIYEYKKLYLKVPQPKYGFSIEETRNKVKEILLEIAEHLIEVEIEQGDKVLEVLYREGVIVFNELPEHLQHKITIERMTDYFMAEPTQALQEIGKQKDAKSYEDMLKPYPEIIGELFKRNELNKVIQINDFLEEHASIPSAWFPERSKLAGQTLEEIWKLSNLKYLRKFFDVSDEKLKETIIKILTEHVDEGLPLLFDILASSQDKKTRMEMIRRIREVGRPAADFLLKELDEQHAWFVLRNIAMLLGDLKEERGLEKLEKLLEHEHPLVRKEVLKTFFKIAAKDVEHMFVKALHDDDPLVKRKAMNYLERINSEHNTFLAVISEVLDDNTKKTNESMQIVAVRALARKGNIKLPDHKTVEDHLLEAAGSLRREGLLGIIPKLSTGKSERVQSSLLDALAKIGTRKSIPIIRYFSHSKNQELKSKAKESLKKINSRH